MAENKKFLDYAGLSKFWELIKSKAAASISTDVDNTNGAVISITAADGKTQLSSDTIGIATNAAAGLMSKEHVAALEGLGTNSINGVKVKNAAATVGDDKHVNIDLAYDDAKKQIQIVDLNNDSAVLSYINVASFVKDGLLKSSDVIVGEGNKVQIKLVFKYADGTESPVYIDVDDLVTIYEAGDGLEIVHKNAEGADETGAVGGDFDDDAKLTGTFRIKVKKDDRYLGVGADGIYTQNIGADIATAKGEAIDAAAAAAEAIYAKKATTLEGYGITDALTAAAIEAQYAKKGTTLAEYGITDAYTKGQVDTELGKKVATSVYTEKMDALDKSIAGKADKATTLEGYGITDALTAAAIEAQYAKKGTTLAEYGITDAYTKTQVDTELGKKVATADYSKKIGEIEQALAGKAAKGTTLAEYGITDAYTKGQVDTELGKKVATADYNTAITGITGRLSTLEGVKHAKDVAFDKTAGIIHLVNADGDKIGSGVDVSDFVVDGLLKSVDFATTTVTVDKIDPETGEVEKNPETGEVEKEEITVKTNELVFTFNVDGGEQTIRVDFSKYVDIYSADETSLTLNDKTFSVKSVDSAKVQITAIPVGGTVLGEQLKNDGVTTISADNLQKVLETLFSRNDWPSAARVIPTSLSASLGNASIDFKNGDGNDAASVANTTVEVGTTIYVTAASGNASASGKVDYKNFTYGYATKTANGDFTAITAGDPTDVNFPTATVTGNYSLAFTTNSGFKDSNNASVTIPSVNSKTLSATAMKVSEGSNKITVTAYSPAMSSTVTNLPEVYYASSLQHLDEDHKFAAVTSATATIGANAATKTANKTVTGAYRIYVGSTDDKITTSAGIKSLTHLMFTNGTNDVTSTGAPLGTFTAGKWPYIAVPASLKLKEILNNMNMSISGNFSEVSTVSYTLPDNTTINYKVYTTVAKYADAVGYNSITIGKA